MSRDERITVGSVVQIDPNHDETFGACFLVVSEVTSWGVQCYVTVPERGGVGYAYYRVEWQHMAYIGQAEWSVFATDGT